MWRLQPDGYLGGRIISRGQAKVVGEKPFKGGRHLEHVEQTIMPISQAGCRCGDSSGGAWLDVEHQAGRPGIAAVLASEPVGQQDARPRDGGLPRIRTEEHSTKVEG